MYDEKSRIERVKKFARIWWKSRANSKKSQEFIALGLGISKRTIQNWEKGLSAPNLFQASEWFNLLGLNPIRYFLEFLYPNLFNTTKSENEAELDEMLINLVKNLSIVEKKQLIHLMSGAHGGSWSALLQLIFVYSKTSLQSRVAAARTILENYEIEEKNGKLMDTKELNPDLDLLKLALSQCKLAAQNGNSEYSTLVFSENEYHLKSTVNEESTDTDLPNFNPDDK